MSDPEPRLPLFTAESLPIPYEEDVRLRWMVRKAVRAAGLRRPEVTTEDYGRSLGMQNRAILVCCRGLCPCGNEIGEGVIHMFRPGYRLDWKEGVASMLARSIAEHIAKDTAEPHIP